MVPLSVDRRSARGGLEKVVVGPMEVKAELVQVFLPLLAHKLSVQLVLQTLTANLGSVRSLGSVTLDLPPTWGARTETLSVLGSSVALAGDFNSNNGSPQFRLTGTVDLGPMRVDRDGADRGLSRCLVHRRRLRLARPGSEPR